MTHTPSESSLKSQPNENKNCTASTSNRKATRRLLKKNFPIFLAEALITFSVSGILLTMVAMSKIIFPNDSFRPLEMGVLISVRMWTVAFAGLLFGFIVDRRSRKPIFIGILVLAGIGRLINGFIPSDNENTMYFLFILCNIIVGFGHGGLQPASISYADDAIEPELRSRFFGLYEIFRQVFQILGMILCAWMFQIGLWREYFWITGIILFICAGLVAFIIKEPKRGKMRHNLKVLADDIQYRYKITRETMRTTIFSYTNLIIFIEGIFTWIIFSIALFLMYPYLQSPPYNISPFVTSFMMVIFGLPGAIIGSIAFSRISDRLGEKNITHRISLVVVSIVSLFFIVIMIFLIPFPELTTEQGNDLLFLMTIEGFILIGIMLFFVRSLLSLYHINQSPIIQAINLPEAQGKISAWNQFLETIGMGIGPLLAGIFLTLYNQNYLLAAVISLSFGIPSAFLWFLARRWIHGDIKNVNDILTKRADELVSNCRK